MYLSDFLKKPTRFYRQVEGTTTSTKKTTTTNTANATTKAAATAANKSGTSTAGKSTAGVTSNGTSRNVVSSSSGGSASAQSASGGGTAQKSNVGGSTGSGSAGSSVTNAGSTGSGNTGSGGRSSSGKANSTSVTPSMVTPTSGTTGATSSGSKSSGGTSTYIHSASDTFTPDYNYNNSTDYAAITNQALQDYYDGKLTYTEARAIADDAEAKRKAKVEANGGTYSTTESYSGFLYGARPDENGYYSNQDWIYLEGYNEPVKLNGDGTYTTRYSGTTYDSKGNAISVNPTTGTTSSTISSTFQTSNGTTPSTGNTTTVTKNTYTSPWTKREYEYSTTEELEQAMAIDNAYYEQQIADQKAAEVEAQRQEALKLATEQKIADLNATYNNSVSSYNQQAAEAAYRAAQAGDNTRLALASSGDLGGIGQKQYSDERNSYDQSYLQLVIEQQNYYNEIQQAIADARYEGDIELANAIADAAEDKLNAYQDAVDNYYNNYIANSDRFYDRNVTDRNFAYQVEQDALDRAEAEKEYNYNKALQKLQLGTLDATDMEALGLSANDAEYWANYYRTLANYDLAEAQAGMDSLVNGSKSSYSGKSGDGSGSGLTPSTTVVIPDNSTNQYVDENGDYVQEYEDGGKTITVDTTQIPTASSLANADANPNASITLPSYGTMTRAEAINMLSANGRKWYTTAITGLGNGTSAKSTYNTIVGPGAYSLNDKDKEIILYLTGASDYL